MMSNSNTDNQWNVSWATAANQYAVSSAQGIMLPNPTAYQVVNPSQNSVDMTNAGWNANMHWYQQMWPQQQPWMMANFQAHTQQVPFMPPSASACIPQNPLPQPSTAANTVNNVELSDKEFETQLKEWEQKFQKWKEDNKNHPDKKALAEYEAQWKSWRDQLLQNRNRQTQHASQEYLTSLSLQPSTANQYLYPTTQAYVPGVMAQANTQYQYAGVTHASDGAPLNYMNYHTANLRDNGSTTDSKSEPSLVSFRKQPIDYTFGQTEQPPNDPFQITAQSSFRDHAAAPVSYNLSQGAGPYFEDPGYTYENEHYRTLANSRWRNNDFPRNSYSEREFDGEQGHYLNNSAPRHYHQYPYFEERAPSPTERFSGVHAEDASQLFKRRALQGKNLPHSVDKRHQAEPGKETALPRSRIEERLAMHAGTKLQGTPTFQPNCTQPDRSNPSDEEHHFPKRTYEPKVIEYNHQPGRGKPVELFSLDYSHGKKRARSPSTDSSEKSLIKESQDNTSAVSNEEVKTQVQGSNSQPAQLFPSAAVIEEQSHNLVKSRGEPEHIDDRTEECLQNRSTNVQQSKDDSPNLTEAEAVMVEDLLLAPGRFGRPGKIVIILRGLPGCGKSHLARMIKEKEVAMGGSAPRILSIDDYYVLLEETGPVAWSEDLEEQYRQNLLKSLKRNLDDGHFSFFIIDALHLKATEIMEVFSAANSRSFAVLLTELENKSYTHSTRKCSEEDLEKIKTSWEEAPKEIPRLDVSWFFKEKAAERTPSPEDIVTSTTSNYDEDSQGSSNGTPAVSKWEMMEQTEEKLDRLDGIVKRKTDKPASVEDWLQSGLPDDYVQPNSASGKKRVRWADIEEKLQQEKMRDMGFVIGHTDWSKMTDTTQGESALTKTKYI